LTLLDGCFLRGFTDPKQASMRASTHDVVEQTFTNGAANDAVDYLVSLFQAQSC